MAHQDEYPDLDDFAQQVGLDPEDLDFMLDLPADLCADVCATFDPGGTKDGNVLGRLQGYVRSVMRRNRIPFPDEPSTRASTPAPKHAGRGQLVEMDAEDFAAEHGLPAECVEFLSALPEDLAQQVFRGFNPSGTKDGNVWGRLLGFIRSLWQRSLHLTEEAASFVRSMSEDDQMRVIAEFDASGSKDGNSSARLLGFARHIANRSGSKGSGSKGPAQTAVPVRTAVARYASRRSPVADFAREMRLDTGSIEFMEMLPEEIATSVMSSFDPSGTKDGNIWGRLFAFIRVSCAKRLGWDRVYMDQLKSLPEDQQMDEILSQIQEGGVTDTGVRQGTPAGHESLKGFLRRWGLDAFAERFLQDMPQQLLDVVLSSFDGSTTKDGNVWGRLLGFVRATWGRQLGLDQESIGYIKSMPEDAQMLLITDFDPRGSKDGNIPARVMHFARKAMAAVDKEASRPPESGFKGRKPIKQAASRDHAVNDIDDFLERCGLDESALAVLKPLSPTDLADVMHSFDPRGTKDGNVLGRLEGYVRSWTAKKRGATDRHSQPVKRARQY